MRILYKTLVTQSYQELDDDILSSLIQRAAMKPKSPTRNAKPNEILVCVLFESRFNDLVMHCRECAVSPAEKADLPDCPGCHFLQRLQDVHVPVPTQVREVQSAVSDAVLLKQDRIKLTRMSEM